MRFRPEHYLEVAQEQIGSARVLRNRRRYPATIYFAGVSVECLLLAYRTREKPESWNSFVRKIGEDCLSFWRMCGRAGKTITALPRLTG